MDAEGSCLKWMINLCGIVRAKRLEADKAFWIAFFNFHCE